MRASLNGEKKRDKLHDIRRILNIAAVVVWVGLVVLCFINRDRITIDSIMSYTPSNLFVAAVILLLLYALKSVSIVIYSGILYAVSGRLFPLPVAISVNILGAAVMVSIPYFIGRMSASEALERIKQKHPKAMKFFSNEKRDLTFLTFIIRQVGGLPMDAVSLYLGARKMRYSSYLGASVLGMLSKLILFAIMGDSLDDTSSPQFRISVILQLVIIAASLAAYPLINRHRTENI